MKRIKVVCNPVDNQVKFPADVVNFYADESNHKWMEAVEEWAIKNKKKILRVDAEFLVDGAVEVVKGEKL